MNRPKSGISRPWAAASMLALSLAATAAEEGARIKQPVLLAMGGKSHEVSPVWQQRQDLLTAWLGNAEPFVLDGATHMLHVDNPRGMAERLAAFVADHSPKN
jgi:pimeloyl-ACP methyl ester carboxylesterase